VPAQADPSDGRPRVCDNERTVAGRRLAAKPRKPDPAAKKGPAAKATWPAAGVAAATVPAKAGVRAGTLPIWVLPPAKDAAKNARKAARAVNVRMLDRAAAAKAGVDGVVFTVSRTDAASVPGRVGVRLDYSGFSQASVVRTGRG
jgi:hypothetical protein